MRCSQCGQEAHWQAYRDEVKLDRALCSYCKPAPWTSGSKERQGVYYRPIEQPTCAYTGHDEPYRDCGDCQHLEDCDLQEALTKE